MRNLNLSPQLTRQLAVASAAAGLSGNAFIAAATEAAIRTMADHDPALAKVLANLNPAESREVVFG